MPDMDQLIQKPIRGKRHMHLENEKKAVTVTNSDITGSSFKNVRAEQLAFKCCNLGGMKMNDVNLTGMSISDANMSELDIDGAQWGGAHFRYIGYSDKDGPESEHPKRAPVQFTHCTFKQGTLTECDFTNATLDNCNITGLVINGVSIENLFKQFAELNKKVAD
ncbi:pentapeptide repeat-containing protein [Paenibacillus hemerocallicola]|uniref:Pentapeptide repeat-containing protein n=2 Tax=Paenibacillus hemerocallicola TaxID=1172614 RepID=A0A5C4TDD1_9BACL|nr:pentapeptide repeat-containing protein [Paenibacillus hemerocallicola]